MVQENNAQVLNGTEAIDNSKEEIVMGTEAIKNTEATQAAEEKLPKFSDVINPADEERKMILVTAVRNKNTKLFWDFMTVMSGADVKATITAATSNKLIILIDERYARKFVETGTGLRGMASTISDLTAKYAKVMGVEVEDKTELTKTLLTEILNQADAGVLSGVWCKPEVLEAEAAKEAADTSDTLTPATDNVEDPFEAAE